METIRRTRMQMTTTTGLGLVLIGSIAVGVAGPGRFVRSCRAAWDGWTAEWRGSRDASSDVNARMDGLGRELDGLRQEARGGSAVPSPAEIQTEISGLKAEVVRLQDLVARHERGMQVVRETLDQMSQCQRGGTVERGR